MKKDVSGTQSIVEIGSSAATAADILKTYEYDGSDGATSNTVFSGADNNSETLAYTVGSIQVYLNGVLLKVTTDYTASTGNSVTLVNSAANADVLQIVAWFKSIGTGDNAIQQLSGNDSTTAFTLATNPYHENQTDIFIDGIYQQKTTYSISGTTLTFSEAPPTGTNNIEISTKSTNLDTGSLSNATFSGTVTANAFAGALTGNVTGNVTGNTSGSAGTVTSIGGHDTDDLSEGSSNLYHTSERVDDRVNTLLQAGSNISLSYDDANNQLTITGTDTNTTYSAGTGLALSSTTFSLSHLGLQSLSDPNADRIAFWDDSAGAFAWLTIGSNLTLSGTTLSGVAAYGNSDVETYLDANGTTFPDNIKSFYGTGSDLSVYHSGSHSYIENSTGNLVLLNNADDKDIILQSDDGSGGAAAYITVDGSAGFTQFDKHTKHTDTIRADFGNSSDLQIYHDGTNSYITNAVGALKIATETSGIAVSIGHSTSETTINDNLTVTGNLTVSGTTTTVNSSTLDVADLNITVGKNATTSSATDTAGLTFGAWSSGTIPTLTWDHSNTRFAMNKDLATNLIGNVTGNVTGNLTGDVTGDVTGNVSGTAATVTTAAQTAITSLGTLTGLDVNGAVTINDNLSLDGSNKELRFYEGSNYIGFEAPALSADQIWVLPSADGSSGHALKTDGSGNLSWGTAGGNAFETVAVSGQSNIVADSTTDTLTFAAGTGITLTTNASNDTVTITNSATGANAFGTIAVSGQSNVAADSTGDTLTFVAGTGVTLTTDASADSVTITNAYVINPLVTDLFTTANATTTTFTLTGTADSEDNLIVFIEGVYQNKNSYAYNTTTKVLTVDSAPGSGEEVVAHQVGKGVAGTGHTQNSYTGNNSTTAYTLGIDPVTENDVFVFLDGVYQHKSTYSITGNTLTFSTAPATGVAIETITPSITEIGVPTNASITPAKLSSGGPSWDSDGLLTVNSSASIGTDSVTISSGSATACLTLAGGTYRSAKAQVSVTDATASEYMTSELLIIHTGSATHITEYGQIYTGSAALGSFTADYNSSNMRLLYTRTGSNSQVVKIKYSAIKI